jgi:hypothetical protein
MTDVTVKAVRFKARVVNAFDNVPFWLDVVAARDYDALAAELDRVRAGACPIGLDQSRELCSAGTCLECVVARARADALREARERVCGLTAVQHSYTKQVLAALDHVLAAIGGEGR